jgi:hypothetical protein
MLNNATIKTRLLSTMIVMVVLVTLLSGIGVYSLREAMQSIVTLEDEAVIAQRLASRVRNRTAEIRTQLALALQHDPTYPSAKLHDHAIEMHFQTIEKSRSDIAETLEKLDRMALAPVIKAALDETAVARKTMFASGIDPTQAALLAGRYEEAAFILVKKLNPSYQQFDKTNRDFLDTISKQGEALQQRAEKRYSVMLTLSIGALLLCIVATIIAGSVLIRDRKSVV